MNEHEVQVIKKKEKLFGFARRGGQVVFLKVRRRMPIKEIYEKVNELFGISTCSKFPSRIIHRSAILGKD